MPWGDGTGPNGMGPMTGRVAGYCAGYSVPGYMNPIPGRGFGAWDYGGFGRGGRRGGRRGRRNWYWATGRLGRSRAAQGLPAFGGWGVPYGDYPYVAELTPQEEADLLKKQADYFKQQVEDIQARISSLEKIQKQEQKK